LDDLRTLLSQLEDKRLDYVQARSRVNSGAQALREIGLSKTAFYAWPEEERKRLDEIAQMFKRETALRAMMVFTENAERAANKISELIDSRNRSIALAASKDISDRVNGRAVQKTELTGEGGRAIQIKTIEVILPAESDDTD